jgi:isopenicillin-N N-acyltransferase-like protein
VANTVAVYARMLGEEAGLDRAGLLAAGARVGDGLQARWPDLVRELEGLAAGAGQPVELLLAVNARTELLAGAECSVVATLDGSGDCTVAQTWDWHPELAGSTLVWIVAQPGGRWFATLTEAGLLAKIGLSSERLCCALNLLTCSADGGVGGGGPVHVLLRVLLDRCDSLVDALSLLMRTPVTGSSCITLGWADAGEAALVAAELSPGGCRLVWPDEGGRLVHTNHFLAAPPVGIDTQPGESPGTLLRRWHLERGLRAGRAPEELLRSHVGRPEAVCRHGDEETSWPRRRRTLAAVAMEPGRARMRVAAGPPCEAAFEEVER